MRSHGTVVTEGRPLCIALAESVPSWSGMPVDTEETPLSDIGAPIATFVNEDGVRFALLQLITGRCEVLASGEEIALVEVVEAPEDYDLEDGLLDFEGVAVQANVLRLGRFGGPVFLFDAARPGEEIQTGGEDRAESEDEDRPDPVAPATHGVVRLEVSTGCWSVSLFEIEQPDLKLTGAWLQREEPAA